MTIITLLSSLPYLSELLTLRDGSLKSWVPNLGIQDLLADENGKVFKYSTYRKSLFYIFFNLFIFFGWLGWYKLKTGKPYRKALLLPLISSVYQLLIILSSARASWANQPEVKFLETLAIALVLAYFYFPKKNWRENSTLILKWGLFFFVSLLPFFHDILISKEGALRSFIPSFGVEQFFTIDSLVLGWPSYRVFVFIFATHLFAQIGWAGWFFDARNKLYRPFLLLPIIFNLYEITIITFNVQGAAFGRPDWKLYTTITLAILIAVNLYFNSDKATQWLYTQPNDHKNN